MRTPPLVMAAAAAFAVCASAVGLAPTASADPNPSECASLQAYVAQIDALAAQHGDSSAVFDAQMAPQVAKACGPPQQVAGGDPNAGHFPDTQLGPPAQAPITPVIPQGPAPKNPYSPAFPDAG
jgi:hypothetical protein